MLVYRIAKTAYVRDLSGAGAKLYGGRWSPAGVPVVYTSESRALAALEFYVNSSRIVPPNVSLATIDIPDGAFVTDVNVPDLPFNWSLYPAPLTLQSIGKNWVNSGGSLLLRVPSAQVPWEFNYVVNPLHAEMSSVRITAVDSFSFDIRLGSPAVPGTP